jgi:hypothetical protein
VINVRHVFFSIDPTQISASPNTPKKNLTKTPVSENYKSQNPPGNSTLTTTEWNQIELHQTPVSSFPPVMPLLQEKTTRKEKKSTATERRLGLVAYSFRFIVLASQQRKKQARGAQQQLRGLVQWDVVQRTPKQRQLGFRFVRRLLCTYFVDLQIAYILGTYVRNMSRLTTTIKPNTYV